MSTVRTISYQIAKLYARSIDSNGNQNPSIDWREVKHLVVQATNAVLRPQRISDHDIPAASIVSYDNLAAVSVGGRIAVDLPVMPISLPMDKGVYRVSNTQDGVMIPIPAGYLDLIRDLDEADLEDQIGYTQEGSKLVFTKQPNGLVNLQLIVADISNLGNDDLLPVSSDQEAQIVKVALSYLMPITPEDNSVKEVTNE